MFVDIIGDPIVDLYINTNHNTGRQYVQQITTCSGGAWIVKDVLNELAIDNMFWTVFGEKLVLTRINKISFYNCSNKDLATKYRVQSAYTHNPSRVGEGLVIVDYNKGTVNRWAEYDDEPNWWKWVIVDSKHRSLDKRWLRADTKILHASIDEYDYNWSQDFDYVILTSETGVIWIGTPHPDADTWMRIKYVPEPVNNSDGAGDVFVAGLAAYLAANNIEHPDMKSLETASRYAHELAAISVQQPHSGMHNYTLELPDIPIQG